MEKLAETRIRIERQYHQDMREIRHKRKNNAQISVLLHHFKKQPVWDYAMKIAIGQSLGMTLSQVSKWNWDQRRKLGMDTSRGIISNPLN